MSSVTRDMVEGYEDIEKKIKEFLWEGDPSEGKKRERTKEELEMFLEEIRDECRDNYEAGAYSLGWID